MNEIIILIGNKLSSRGLNPTSIEKLSRDLGKSYKIESASDKKNIFLRIIDIIYLIFIYRKSCKLIIVDVFSTKAFYFSGIVMLLSRFLNIKALPVFRGGALPERFNNNTNLFKFFFPKNQLIICPSSFLADFFKAQKMNCKIIHNYIDIKDYSYKIRNNIKPKLFWVRSIHEIYNPLMAIHVLNEVLKFCPEAELCMVGPFKDNSIEKLRELVLFYKLEHRVKLMGKLSKKEWIKLSNKYDIFINTTNFDNQPLSVIEAMALGLLVVSTNVGGIPNMLINNKTAKLVGINNDGEMAKAIKEYLFDNPTTMKISANARKFVELSFDQDKVIPQWIDVIENSINSDLFSK